MTTHAQAKPAGTPTWVDLATPDPDAARSFYQALFGWEYEIGGPEYGGYTNARSGGRTAAGLVGPMPGAPPAPAAWSVYFASHDIEADVARAAELGAKLLFPPLAVGSYGSMAICEDPTGAAFGFWQAGSHLGAEVTDEPGATAWYELYSTHAGRARDFYTALLGATAETMEGGLEYYTLKHGDDPLAGIMQIDPSWGGFRPQWIAYFAVEDIEAAVAAAASNGGKVMGPIDDSPFGRIAALMDPAGAAFKLIEPPRA